MVQVKLDDRLLKKLDVALQATGAPLHRFFDGADFDAGNVLRMGDSRAQHAWRQNRDAENKPADYQDLISLFQCVSHGKFLASGHSPARCYHTETSIAR